MYCGVFGTPLHGLYPLEASSTPPPSVTTKISPDFDKCPLGAKSYTHAHFCLLPLPVENYGFRAMNTVRRIRDFSVHSFVK